MNPPQPQGVDDVGELTRLPAVTAVEVCRKGYIGEVATVSLSDSTSPREYLSALMAQGELAEAVKFLAHALPKREALYWGCICVRESLAPDTPAGAVHALEAAEGWVREPNEEHRRAAMAAVDAAGLESPGACIAFGAFVSEGSLAPPEAPVVPPADYLTGHSVSGAIMLAAVTREPERAEEKYRRFIHLGIGLANGTLSLDSGPMEV
jgi:hypothetical protein